MTSISETAAPRPYWFVGATYDGTDDQIPRFLTEGIWENGWRDQKPELEERVKSMLPGDRIAIKASFKQKNNLPFPNPGQHTVGAMYIKAVGTITENPRNGHWVEVDWAPFDKPRTWYFSQLRQTIHEVLPGDWAKNALIDFAFENKPQDINRFRSAPRWWQKFGDTPYPQDPADGPA